MNLNSILEESHQKEPEELKGEQTGAKIVVS